MHEKPNPSSVTTVPCSSGLLKQQAAEPETPLEFDTRLGDYERQAAHKCTAYKTREDPAQLDETIRGVCWTVASIG
jgi:hypothetical protein